MQIKDLYWNADTESFAEMFNVKQEKATAIAKEINELTVKFSKRFSDKKLSPDELTALSNILSHPARFLYYVMGEMQVKSESDVILIYSLSYQSFTKIKNSVPPELMQMLVMIQNRNKPAKNANG